MWLDLMTVLAFVLIVAAVFFLRALILGWRGPYERQLAGGAGGATEGRSTLFGPLTEPLAAQLPTLSPTEDPLVQDLRRAGYYKPSARFEFLAIRNVLAIAAVIITGILAVTLGPGRPGLTAQIVIWGFAAAAVLYIVPWLLLRQQARNRVERIRNGLPDAFDMLTMCLTGGLSLQESLGHVSRELFGAHPDLAVEFDIVRRQTEMLSLTDAFRQFAGRIDAPEVVSLAGLVQQTERLGSNVGEALRQFADGIRTKLRQTADERASKAGVKLLFPLVLCLAPSALIILWGPAFLELREFFRTFSVN